MVFWKYEIQNIWCVKCRHFFIVVTCYNVPLFVDGSTIRLQVLNYKICSS
jgi:hypothetical protein